LKEILRDVVGGSPANAKALLPTGCSAKVRFRNELESRVGRGAAPRQSCKKLNLLTRGRAARRWRGAAPPRAAARRGAAARRYEI